jgi:hypothetical protein
MRYKIAGFYGINQMFKVETEVPGRQLGTKRPQSSCGAVLRQATGAAALNDRGFQFRTVQ